MSGMKDPTKGMTAVEKKAWRDKVEPSITENVNFYRLFSGAQVNPQMAESVLTAMEEHVEAPPVFHTGDYASHCIHYAAERGVISWIKEKIEQGRKQAHENNI